MLRLGHMSSTHSNLLRWEIRWGWAPMFQTQIVEQPVTQPCRRSLTFVNLTPPFPGFLTYLTTSSVPSTGYPPLTSGHCPISWICSHINWRLSSFIRSALNKLFTLAILSYIILFRIVRFTMGPAPELLFWVPDPGYSSYHIHCWG